MRDVSGDQLRRIAWWLDWPPVLVLAPIGWFFPSPTLWFLVVVWVPVCVVVGFLSTIVSGRIRRAAQIVDAADELVESVQVEGLREIAARLRRP